ncbi:MAG: hypothetical protein QM775_35125 [Pirellulales bacterium]
MLSGKDGQVLIGATPIADVTRWTLRTTARIVSYASNATGGHRATIAGNGSATGTIAFQLSTSIPPPTAGQHAVLRLHLDATHRYEVPAVIDTVELETDIDTGALIGGTASFMTDGPWTPPTFA